MLSRRHIIIGGGSAALLTGCVTVPQNPAGFDLDGLISSPDAQRFTLPPSPHGRMIIPMMLPNGRVVQMMLDTGATRSALYAREWDQLSDDAQPSENIRIFGMIATGVHPVKALSTVTLGTQDINDITIARLSNPTNTVAEKEIHDGILGMDILIRFHLYYDGPNNILMLVPKDIGPVRLPSAWRHVPLSSNPFLEDGRDLHFMKVRVGNALIDALLDTGAEFNLMNWNTDRFPQLRNARRRMLERWQVEGAIGEFKPIHRVNAYNIRMGQKFFERTQFVVLDFETLNVLGIDGRPFVIIGADSLKDERYLIDFEANRMSFAPIEDPQITSTSEP